MNTSTFKLPKSATVPTSVNEGRLQQKAQKEFEKGEKQKAKEQFREIREYEKKQKKEAQSASNTTTTTTNSATVPQKAPTNTITPKAKMELLQKAKASIPVDQGYRRPHHHHTHNQSHHRPNYQHQSCNEPAIPMDYHLRMPAITDNPKKLPRFDYIRTIPNGEEYAVYLQHNQLSFCNKKSSTPSAIITHRTEANKTLFMCTMIRTGYFIVTDVLFYKGSVLSTNEERMKALLELFSKGHLLDINTTNSSVTGTVFESATFNPTHFFCQWTDFTRGSLHIPYEIKHLEYCFYSENVLRQTHRFIYILNKKGLKKSTHVYTSSRDFRVDVAEVGANVLKMDDFKTCVLMGKPYLNVVGYSHLDELEESDEE